MITPRRLPDNFIYPPAPSYAEAQAWNCVTAHFVAASTSDKAGRYSRMICVCGCDYASRAVDDVALLFSLHMQLLAVVLKWMDQDGIAVR